VKEEMMSATAFARTGRNRPDRISVAGTIVDLFLISAAAILFTFFSQRIGFWWSADDPASFTPLLAPGFAAFMPWLNTFWLWAYCLCLANLALQRWTPVTRIADLALNLYGAALCAALFEGSPFLALPVVTVAAKSVLVVVCVACLIGALDQLVHLLRWRPGADEPAGAGTS
jgi:hypothetical protein